MINIKIALNRAPLPLHPSFFATSKKQRSARLFPISIPILSSQSQSQPQVQPDSLTLPLSYEQKAFVVLRNYLVPVPPNPYRRLIDFLIMAHPTYNRLDYKEAYVKMKGLSKREISSLMKEKQEENFKVEERIKEYNRIFRSIKILPYYYHMLLVNAEMGPDKNWPHDPSTLFTQKQLYRKLTLIHPVIRAQTYEKYQQAHMVSLKKKNQDGLTKQGYRLPILDLTHPYQLYLVDRYSQEGLELPHNEHYLREEDIHRYDQQFEQLDTRLRNLYLKKMNSKVVEYQGRILEIAGNTGVPIERIQHLAVQQFSADNERMLRRISVL